MKDAYSHLVKLLSIKDYARHTLLKKLDKKGYTESEALDALEKLREVGLYKEENYTHARVKGLAKKGHGPYLIENKLRLEQIIINTDEIESILEEYDINFTEEVTRLAHKKIAIMNEGQVPKRVRLEQYLLQKGHRREDIQIALDDCSSSL